MKFISFKYTYGLCNPYVNIGDYIQTLAVQNALQRMGYREEDFVYHDRDGLHYFSQTDGQYLVVMQGWFSEARTWVPNSCVVPIFIGTHFNHATRAFISTCAELRTSLSRYAIGARDPSTALFLKTMGINSYFSRCLTLTFPKRENVPIAQKCFIVDVPNHFLKYIPLPIREEAQIIHQREIGCGESDQYHQNAYFQSAKNFLNKYKTEASLIITSALHCALPCIAMGIPTVFISSDKYNVDFQERLDVVADIVPIYGLYDLKAGTVNWTPEVPDIEDLKRAMLENLKLMIDKSLGRGVNEDRLNQLQEKISEKRNIFYLIEPSEFHKRIKAAKNFVAKVIFYLGRKIHG